MPTKKSPAVGCIWMSACTVLMVTAVLTSMGKTASAEGNQQIHQNASNDLRKASDFVRQLSQRARAVGDYACRAGLPLGNVRFWKRSVTTASSSLRDSAGSELSLVVGVPVAMGFMFCFLALLWWDHGRAVEEMADDDLIPDRCELPVEDEATQESSDSGESYHETMDSQASHHDSPKRALSSPLPWSQLLVQEANRMTSGLLGTLDLSQDNGLCISVFIHVLGFVQVVLKPFFLDSPENLTDLGDALEGGGEDCASDDASNTDAGPNTSLAGNDTSEPPQIQLGIDTSAALKTEDENEISTAL